MTFEGLLSELAKRSVKFRREGDQIRYRGTKEELDSSLLKELGKHKPSIFKWLGDEKETWGTP